MNFINKHNQDKLPIIVLTIIFFIYRIFSFKAVISNDSITNIQQILNYDILSRSSHFTFHLVSVVGYYILGSLGFSAINSTEIVLSLISLLGAYCLYLISLNFLNNKRMSILLMTIYAISSGIFRFSIQCEYLILVPSLLLITLSLYNHGNYLFSGTIFALGILTSPFIVLAAPAFFLYTNIKETLYKKNLLFLGGFLFIYIIVSSFTVKETMSGDWSYLSVYDFYSQTIQKMNFLRVLLNLCYGYIRSFNVLILLIIPGLYHCYKIKPKLFYITLLIIIFHLPTAIPEQRYGGYQLPTYPFIMLSAFVGLNSVLEKSRYINYSIISIFLVSSLFIVFSESKFNSDLRETYLKLQNDPTIPDSSILFVYQSSKPIKTIYATRFKVVDIHTDFQESMIGDQLGYSKPDYENLLNGKNLYLIESGVSMPDDHFKKLFGKLIRSQGSKYKGFGKDKLISKKKGLIFIPLNVFPIEVYKISINKSL
jgi:hypothetical protein